DIRGDEWFLTCHFVDDMVMPGTLMYECCVHTLRVLLMRMGWVTEQAGVCYEPVPGVPSTLRCRGPVTPATRVVTYEVAVKEVGYNPEPYVIADALVYADGQRIVQFIDMSLKMTGATREQIEATWCRADTTPASLMPIGAACLNSGAMYRCHKSAGSKMCMSASQTTKSSKGMAAPSLWFRRGIIRGAASTGAVVRDGSAPGGWDPGRPEARPRRCRAVRSGTASLSSRSPRPGLRRRFGSLTFTGVCQPVAKVSVGVSPSDSIFSVIDVPDRGRPDTTTMGFPKRIFRYRWLIPIPSPCRTSEPRFNMEHKSDRCTRPDVPDASARAA
ncbi:MAG: hypothetical protein IH921_12800, partial [Gemmatimonadetes bacterium]|nr:hypothetical protein [Gemmatimonadota bacterium]